MFLKKTVSKGKVYLQVVHSYKDENNVTRHQVLFNLGRLDKLAGDESAKRIISELFSLVSNPQDFIENGTKGK